METVLLAAVLAQDNLRNKSNPSPALTEEQRDEENSGPNPEGEQELRPHPVGENEAWGEADRSELAGAHLGLDQGSAWLSLLELHSASCNYCPHALFCLPWEEAGLSGTAIQLSLPKGQGHLRP